jgi:Flp pilus assembly pilin Flp
MVESPARAYVGACGRHVFERAHGACHRCGGPFCEDCLVYPFGIARPGLCVTCALAAGGIRRDRRRHQVSRFDHRANETGASVVEYSLVIALLAALVTVIGFVAASVV